LSTIVALETGTPKIASGGAPHAAAEHFRYYAGWIDKIEGNVTPVDTPETLNYSVLEPYGVVAVILTWNSPLYSIGMTVAPPLAAGNPVVLKPPELAPFAALRFGELYLEASLPPGVVNVVPGGPEAGEALVGHMDIDKVSFTGGVSTAERILLTAARGKTPVLLELGGKSANIVFDDANLAAAAPTAVFMSVVALSGQGCSLATRLLVQDSIYDEVARRVVELARSIRVGDPFDPSSMMGPVISAGAAARIEGVIRNAVNSRAGKLLSGGERLGDALANGFFIAPTIFGDVDNASSLAQEEIFGPVLSMIRFRDEEEAVRLANDTKYGLAGYIWSRDIGRAHRVAARLDAGFIGVNCVPAPTHNTPFGGVKRSGYGREGGFAGLAEFLRIKNVSVSIA
jgi:acyl-CoA reductase-like NAD-dependent aldehyde dehydrogenase